MVRAWTLAALLAVSCSAPAPAGTGGGSAGGSRGGGSGGFGGAAGGATGGGTATGGGGAATGGGAGADAGVIACTQDSQCPGGLCRRDFPSSPRVCVTPCAQAGDCNTPGTFCSPQADGGAGLCVPRQPAHCLDCLTDSDCGAFADVCTATATDPQRACHVDCSLAGAAACPPEYTCGQVMVGGVPRMLCSPATTGCANASGGYCDSSLGAQACTTFVPDAGTCSGMRYCAGGRFDVCAGPAPSCRPACSTASQAGCTEEPCPAAVASVTDCGACGRACPGAGSASADVACSGGSCSLTCQGEHYDVNASATDGCEVADAPVGNHVASARTDLGSVGCGDGNGHTVHHDGKLPSDLRAHLNPGVAGFDAASGSAPDELKVYGSGGYTCVDDIDITLAVTGSSAPACYRLRIVTTDVDKSCTTNPSGTCTITSGSGSYNDGSDLLFTVTKTCSASTRDAPSYSVDGHL